MKSCEFAVLFTPEGKQLALHPSKPWNVHPRPQRKRDSFFCLNGPWEFSVNDGESEEILVPFPPESLLSGIHRRLGPRPKLYYRRTFALPAGFLRNRVLLHFGAVDQTAEVFFNNSFVGRHTGGYEPFSFDVTPFLAEKNVVEVCVTDELDTHVLPYGKQCEKRGGMWYTPVSGIWQTVWLESVPETYVRDLRIETGTDSADIFADGVSDGTVTVRTPTGTVDVPLKDGHAHIVPEHPRMWSPEDPYLYEFTIRAGEDTVQSYFALRTLDIRTVDGIPRLCLNGKPYFFHGLLDQGYWSDGLFTPASPVCYENDIRAMKELGFNMLRKHIKTEPEQFYYDCDRLGMVVFQDMVNNGAYSFLRDTALPTIGLKRLPDKHLHRDKETREAFETAMEETVRRLYSHPCICCWTIFNEGWGQFDSGRMYRKLKELDTTRFIDTASGWFTGAESDVVSPHVYFKPVKLKKADKPLVLSEFGGYSYKPEGHAFNLTKTYGYKFFSKQEDFENSLVKLYEDEIIPAVPMGLCAAVYTQVSDVEDETNGLLSYDRRVRKVDAARMKKIAEKLKI